MSLSVTAWTVVEITAFHSMTDGETVLSVVKDACKIWKGANTLQRANVWRF